MYVLGRRVYFSAASEEEKRIRFSIKKKCQVPSNSSYFFDDDNASTTF